MGQNDALIETVRLFPQNPSFYFWEYALKHLNLPESLLNTLTLSLLVALIQTVSCTLIGYGLARFRFRGRGIAFAFVIILMLVPFRVINIPQYQSFANMNIGSFQVLDTFLPILILSFTGLGLKEGLYIYLLRESFVALPGSLEEAAYIDGAGVFGTFFRVMLPNVLTIAVTTFLFSFCWAWTDTVYTPLYLTDTKVFANSLNDVVVRIAAGVDTTSTLYARCAAILFIMIPLFGLFAVCQRFFVQSISQAGLAN